MGVIYPVWAWPLVGESHRWVWYGMVTNLREASGCDITCLGVASWGGGGGGWGRVNLSWVGVVWHGYQFEGGQ